MHFDEGVCLVYIMDNESVITHGIEQSKNSDYVCGSCDTRYQQSATTLINRNIILKMLSRLSVIWSCLLTAGLFVMVKLCFPHGWAESTLRLFINNTNRQQPPIVVRLNYYSPQLDIFTMCKLNFWLIFRFAQNFGCVQMCSVNYGGKICYFCTANILRTNVVVCIWLLIGQSQSVNVSVKSDQASQLMMIGR